MKFNRRDFFLYSWPRHNMVASHKYVHSIVQIDNQFFVLIIKRPSVCPVPNESMEKLSTQTAGTAHSHDASALQAAVEALVSASQHQIAGVTQEAMEEDSSAGKDIFEGVTSQDAEGAAAAWSPSGLVMPSNTSLLVIKCYMT